jgi:hypothetical protein
MSQPINAFNITMNQGIQREKKNWKMNTSCKLATTAADESLKFWKIFERKAGSSASSAREGGVGSKAQKLMSQPINAFNITMNQGIQREKKNWKMNTSCKRSFFNFFFLVGYPGSWWYWKHWWAGTLISV